jgi:hypothetical protein
MQSPTKKKSFRSRLLLLSGSLLIALVVLAGFLSFSSKKIGSIWRSGPEFSKMQQQEELLKVDELLHARLWQLQSMDQKYASLMTVKTDEAELTKTNAFIQYAEGAFQKSIDSIASIGTQYDTKMGTNDFQNITAFFKTILENRRFLSYIRLGLISEDKGSAGYRQIVFKQQEELNKKDKIIAAYAVINDNEKVRISLQNAVAEKDKQIRNLETQIQKEQSEGQANIQSVQKLQTELVERK